VVPLVGRDTYMGGMEIMQRNRFGLTLADVTGRTPGRTNPARAAAQPSSAAGSRSPVFPHLRLEGQLLSEDLAAESTSGPVWLLAGPS
jgi:hypothetical protein